MKEIEWISGAAVAAASAPLWHPVEKRVYWSDVAGCRLYRCDPATGTVETVLDDGRPVGAMTLQADGALLLFRDQANVVVFRDGAIDATVINGIADYRQTVFASAVAGPSGNVICSVLSDSHHTGRLLSLDRTGKLTLVADGFGIPSGLAFLPDGSAFLFNDAHQTHVVTWRFGYGVADESPAVLDRAVFHACFDDGDAFPGAPAGLALASDGSVLIARHGGAMIVRHAADGSVAEGVRLPVRRPLGLCFGGEGLADIFVTTSGGHRKQFDGLHAGELAVLRGGDFRGVAPFVSRIMLSDDAAMPEAAASAETAPAPEAVAVEVAAEPASTPALDTAPAEAVAPAVDVPEVQETVPAAPPETPAASSAEALAESANDEKPVEPTGFVSL